MFKLAELHPIYGSVNHDEALEIANLGAICYLSVKETLQTKWDSADDVAKASIYRQEGRQSVLDEVKYQLSSAEKIRHDLCLAEGTIMSLRESMTSEVKRQLDASLEGIRKDNEINKLSEMSSLREQLATALASSDKQYINMVARNNDHLLSVNSKLEEQLIEKNSIINKISELNTKHTNDLILANTKSSHAIGKMGEATLLEMIMTTIIPIFPYSSVKDMTSISHVADFHLSVMCETGLRAKLLIDSKKYKNPVKTTEIEKLFGDVDADDEAQGGMMISLESPVVTMKQFQIALSPRNKPIMCITFCNMSDEIRRNVLEWAVRVMIEVITMKSDTGKGEMLSKLSDFLIDLDKSVHELEQAMKCAYRTADSLKEIRDGLFKRIIVFRGGNKESDTNPTTIKDGCEYVSRNGNRCGRKVHGGSLCKTHTKNILEHV